MTTGDLIAALRAASPAELDEIAAILETKMFGGRITMNPPPSLSGLLYSSYDMSSWPPFAPPPPVAPEGHAANFKWLTLSSVLSDEDRRAIFGPLDLTRDNLFPSLEAMKLGSRPEPEPPLPAADPYRCSWLPPAAPSQAVPDATTPAAETWRDRGPLL